MSEEIRLTEIKQLEALKKTYVEGPLAKETMFIVTSAGFCVATLSSTHIPSIVNVGLAIAVLVLFLILTVRTLFPKNNLLAKYIREYRKKYQDNKETQDYLNEMSPWKGFEHEKWHMWFPSLISVLFCVYTLFEHLMRLAT